MLTHQEVIKKILKYIVEMKDLCTSNPDGCVFWRQFRIWQGNVDVGCVFQCDSRVAAQLIMTFSNYNTTVLQQRGINLADMCGIGERSTLLASPAEFWGCALINLRILLFENIPIKWVIKLSEATLETAVQHFGHQAQLDQRKHSAYNKDICLSLHNLECSLLSTLLPYSNMNCSIKFEYSTWTFKSVMNF